MIKQALIILVWALDIVVVHHLLNLSLYLSVFIFVVGLVVWTIFRNVPKVNLAPLIILIGCWLGLMSLQPKNNRDWWLEASVLPSVEIENNQVTIKQFRNFQWQGRRDAKRRWENRNYNLMNLDSLDLVVEPFNDSKLMAHTMLVFGFENQGNVVVSVEARKEQHEEYGILAGALRQFEIIYLFGEERDLFSQRAIHRNSKLYLFPIKADKEFIVNLFKDIAKSANGLHVQPKFYRTIRDNCTTTLAKHIDRLYDNKIGLRYETLFPAQVGKLLYDLGHMDTTLPYDEVMSVSQIDSLVRKYVDQPNFSTIIRTQSIEPYKTSKTTTS